MIETSEQQQKERASLPLPVGSGGEPLVASAPSGEPLPSSIRPSGVAAHSEKNTEFEWKFSEETHQYVREYISLADQKAAFFFAGSTALIAFLYDANLVQSWVKDPHQWVFVDMLSFAATIGLAFSALSCLATIFPRLKGSKQGHLFFGAIAEFKSRKDYAAAVHQREVGELMEEKLCHVHDLATICKQKLLVLKIGLWFGAGGVTAMILLLILTPTASA